MKTNVAITSLKIVSESDLKVALLRTHDVCVSLQFSEVSTCKISTTVSELVRNILKYAGTGQITIYTYSSKDQRGIEIVVSDQGPGITDLKGAMRDHSSSSGTLGLGLPGVQRLMDYFYIESHPGKGTTVTVRKFL